jgi:hypothetical protein
LELEASLYKNYRRNLNKTKYLFTMKKLRIITLMTVLALISADSFGAGWFQKWRAQKQQRVVVEQPVNGDSEAVGAPLDGGLLVLLGAAGAAYYGARRKKRKSAE